MGKVSAVAKGAKKSKSKFLSSTLPFSYGSYTLFRGKSLYNISESELINSFQIFLNDLDTLTYASYLCELVDIAVVEEESNRELFKEFITAFYLMSNKAVDYELLCRAFEVKLLMHTGYGLNLDNCCICKKKINSSNYINLQYNGGVCEECDRINGLRIQYGTFNALKFISKTSMDKLFRLSLSDEIKSELYKILSHLISHSYSREPKSLGLFNYLKRSENNE